MLVAHTRQTVSGHHSSICSYQIMVIFIEHSAKLCGLSIFDIKAENYTIVSTILGKKAKVLHQPTVINGNGNDSEEYFFLLFFHNSIGRLSSSQCNSYKSLV